MTSKEALNRVCNNSINNTNWQTGIKRKDAVKKLEKDLEVLEILKNSLELKEDGDYLTINFRFCCYKEDLDRDYEIRTIKEWLENE